MTGEPPPPPPSRLLEGVLRREGDRFVADAGSIRIRLDSASVASAGLSGGAPPAEAGGFTIPADLQRAVAAAAKLRARLEGSPRPGVVAVEAGYKFVNGLIQDQAAVVVYVAGRRPSSDVLPLEVDGVPVDIAPVTPRQRLEAADARLEAAPIRTSTPRFLIDELQGLQGVEEAAKQITYRPPSDVHLEEVSGAMTVTCHVSPDAGWTVLQPFLSDTTQSLVLGMYDFTAPHILRTMRAMLRDSSAELQMTLGPGESLPQESDVDSTKANDVAETKVIRSLKRVASDRLRVAFAHVGNGQTFASAYHIKVAVKDGRELWLSSGNWQSSNQPEIDFLKPDADRRLFRRYNRDWHVVVEHAGLARQFQAFLEHDFTTASAELAEAAVPPMPDVLVPADQFLLEERAAAPVQVFPALRLRFTAAEPLRVMPLLTPDNYASEVLRVLRKARRKVYFQNQSLSPSLQAFPEFRKLMELLRDYSKDPTLDVRIIFRDIGDMRKKLTSLKAFGFDMARIRIQSACHTKGIVLDSQVCVVGSHNWTNEGTQQNRDASLIFHDAQISRYYEQIFLNDWEHFSRTGIREEAVPVLADSEEAAGGDMIRVPWSEYEGED